MQSRTAAPCGRRRACGRRDGIGAAPLPPPASQPRRPTTTRAPAAQPSAPDAGALAASPFLEEVGPTGGVTLHAVGGGAGASATTTAATPRAAARTRSLADAAAASLAAAFLPRGFPASVTPDYLPYQLAAAPSHVAGWVSQSLVTGALLAALAAGSGGGSGGEGAAAAPPPPAPPPPPAVEAGASAGDAPPRPAVAAAAAAAAAPAAATAAAAAAAKWVTKDGLGAAGRLLVGSRLGTAIDDDPRRWRMVAEAATTAGLALEVATAAAPPSAFVPLASAGTLCRAVGKGIARPAFRVVQTHFATPASAAAAAAADAAAAAAASPLRPHRRRRGPPSNVGDVAAKEEVWEVAAQVVGLAAAVAVLRAAQAGGLGPAGLAGVWAAAQAAHVGFRALSLKALRFRRLNHKRAAAAAAAFVAAGGVDRALAAAAAGAGAGGAAATAAAAPGRLERATTPPITRLPGVDAANAAEPMLASAASVRPRCALGVTVAEVVRGGQLGGGAAAAAHPPLAALLAAHAGERYALAWEGGPAARGRVLLLDGAGPDDALVALLQAAVLDAQAGHPPGPVGAAALAAARAAARAAWPSFRASLEAAGWDVAGSAVLVGPTRVRAGGRAEA